VAERNPALEFLSPAQMVEVSEATAKSLGIGNGTEVVVTGDNGKSLRAVVAIRHRVPDDVCFLIEGTRENPANLLGGAGSVTLAEAPAEVVVERPAVVASGREEVEW
jgi:predicted molibdopterin-dependent oxidoreductase YjgC